MHGKLESQERVLEVHGVDLQLLETDGVIKGAHVQQDSDAVAPGLALS